MDFSEKLKQFVCRAESMKDTITSEEATKTSLIMPFFSMLGYDVFNPEEFLPEFTADVGIKRGEKVDYAIMQNGNPVIIIEAKPISSRLDKHGSQLFRYFGTTSAKFAILTNGLRYRFFTDLDTPNRMDSMPFLDFNILDMSQNQITELQKFEKTQFDTQSTRSSASVLRHIDTFKRVLAAEFESPSDQLVRFFLPEVYTGTKTQAIVERFRPILKQSMQQFINETMSSKLQSALSPVSSPEPAPEPAPAEEQQLTLTSEELAAYQRLCELFSGYIDPSDITYRKKKSYVNILYQDNNKKWICRLAFSAKQLSIIMPDADKQDIRRNIANLYELGNYSRYMLSVISRYTKLLQPLEPANPPVYQLVLERRFPKHCSTQNM